MRKGKFVTSLVVVCMLAFALFSAHAGAETLTPQQFGGNPYMKPLDGRLELGVQFPLINYTPYSVDPGIIEGTGLAGTDYTLITVLDDYPEVFTHDDLGMRFCGLFNHANPPSANYDRVDEFFPQEQGARYAEVVHVIDGRNIIVDFEFNGGDRNNPQVMEEGKGYIFYDNSEALNDMIQSYLDDDNAEDMKLQPLAVNDDYVLTTYVAPELDSFSIADKPYVKIWTGTAERARIKMGIEDYYHLERNLGETIYTNPGVVWDYGMGRHGEQNLVSHNIQWVPPHRTIPNARTFKKALVTGRKGPGIIAFINQENRAEFDAIEAGEGLTDEHFQLIPSSVGAGGSYSGDGSELEHDVIDFGYELHKNFNFEGSSAAGSKTAVAGGGEWYGLVDGNVCFTPQTKYNPATQQFVARFTTDYSGLPEGVQEKGYYSPYVLEVTSPHGNLLKTTTLGGSNRINIFNIDRFIFLASAQGVRRDNPGEFMGYYDICYSRDEERNPWGYQWREGRRTPVDIDQRELWPTTPGKAMLVNWIPETGERYTIGRHYDINEGFNSLKDMNNAQIATVKTIHPNAIRTAICWTTVLDKYGIDIDPVEDIPANAVPLELQPGDRFRIPGGPDPNRVYTVMRKQRGLFPSFPAEFVYDRNRNNEQNRYHATNFQSYRYFYLILDRDLPEDLGMTFEIEMVESTSEYLLDGEPRPTIHSYMGISTFGPRGLNPQTSGMGIEAEFGSGLFTTSDVAGHLAYNQAEHTYYFRNVDFNSGFWRENTNSRPSQFTVTDPETGAQRRVRSLRFYSKGHWLINVENAPIGQWGSRRGGANSWDGHRAILNALDIEPHYPMPKYYVYNSPSAHRIDGHDDDPGIEVHETDEHAPDLPQPLLDLLERLPQDD